VGALPNLVVIGAGKCGTSALHYYLDLHPEIQMSAPKELHFFLSEEDFDPEPFIAEPEERRLFNRDMNWSRGRRWYESHFSPDVPMRGEATPGYSAPWHPNVATRMAGLVPEARLIYMVRDPVERIVSGYIQLRALGREWRTLNEAARRPSSVYVARTRYASLLRPFLELYPRSQILILRQEDLLLRRRETLSRVFGWLGVDERFWSSKMERERHVSQRKSRSASIVQRIQQSRLAVPGFRLPQEVKWTVERWSRSAPANRPALDEKLRQELLEELDPEISGLEGLTGWDLSAWRRVRPAHVEAY
jgi:sulfotransferase family protein